MMVVILDSNIFISGFLFKGIQRKLIEYAIAGKYRIGISDAILSEIHEVLLRPKFKLSPELVKKIINEIESLCILYYPTESVVGACRDNDDHIILECAITAKADYIVSGDEDLLSLKKYKSTVIMNSADFFEIVACM